MYDELMDYKAKTDALLREAEGDEHAWARHHKQHDQKGPPMMYVH